MDVAQSYANKALGHGRTGYAAALAGAIGGLFLVRLYFAMKLLPAPVGDSATSLEPIYNYCRGGRLISYLVPYDPTGAYRFIWHGPLPPILYRLLDDDCSLQSLFALQALSFLIIPLALLVPVRRGLLSTEAWFCLCVFCLAATAKVGFRPEHLCVAIVVVAYVARVVGAVVLEGICWGGMVLASPLSGVLYGVVRALSSGRADLKDAPLFLIGAVPTIVVVFLLYPYSVADWIRGMAIQAHIVSSYTEGHLYTYYIRADFLPLWGLSLAVILIALTTAGGGKNWQYLLLLPFIWYFGLRRPTTSYNLLTTVVLLFLLGYPLMSRRMRALSAASLLLPGLLGFAQSSWRDAVSLAVYPDSFGRTRSLVAGLSAAGDDIVAAPAFAIFTNPALGIVASPYLPHRPDSDRSSHVLINADSGSGGLSCPVGTALINKQPQKPWWFVFKSSSSWMVNVCRYPAASGH